MLAEAREAGIEYDAEGLAEIRAEGRSDPIKP